MLSDLGSLDFFEFIIFNGLNPDLAANVRKSQTN
jgi:hypothetical protein